MTTFRTAVEDFLSSREYLLEEGSQKEYPKKLNILLEWVESNNIQVEGFKKKQATAYVNYACNMPNKRTGEKLSTATTRQIVRILKTFLTWCSESEDYEKIVSAKLAKDIKLPRLEEKVQPVYSTNHLDTLRKACKKYKNADLQVRNDAIVCLLFDAGLRADELVTLKKSDVHFSTSKDEPGYVLVHGKENKWRTVSFGSKTEKALKKYLSVRPKNTEVEELFISGRRDEYGKYAPMHYGGIWAMMSELLEHANIGKEEARRIVHQFRHSSSIQYLKAGGNLAGLSRRLGHADTKTIMTCLKAYTPEEERKNGISPLDSIGK